MSKLVTISDAAALIESGRPLLVAASENVLSALPTGNWIGGTIEYFTTTDKGGFRDDRSVHVTELPADVEMQKIQRYGTADLARIPSDISEDGFALIVLPGLSEVHSAYALQAPEMPEIFDRPILGWVSGVPLEMLGKTLPKVVDGRSGELTDEVAVVMHCRSAERPPHVGIVNVFEQGQGATIVFDKTGFEAKRCTIDGEPSDFFAYARSKNLDLERPLVADMSGEQINVSFREIDQESETVRFFAPVQAGVEYRHARPLGASYPSAFRKAMPTAPSGVLCSYNCILNYLYGELETADSLPLGGPATFGEVAYVLLNQTMVFLNAPEQVAVAAE